MMMVEIYLDNDNELTELQEMLFFIAHAVTVSCNIIRVLHSLTHHKLYKVYQMETKKCGEDPKEYMNGWALNDTEQLHYMLQIE